MMFDTALLLLGGVILLASVILTAWLRNYIIQRQVMDVPNARSSHITPTPRGGGLAFIVVFYIAVSILFFLGKGAGDAEFYAIFFGGLIIAAVGWLDDYFSLSQLVRIVIHFSVSFVCLLYLGVPEIQLAGSTLPLGWMAYPLMAILLTWCLNFFNFMDGIDGIAAIQAVTMLLGALIILTVTQADAAGFGILYCLPLLAAVSGFLIWNYPPAKIFMGDTASGFLGFVLGMFAIITSVNGSMNVWSWLILFGVFISDATLTLLIRIWRREPWYLAHRQHWYQRCAMDLQTAEGVLLAPERARAYAHGMVVMMVAAFNLCWLTPLALAAAYYPAWGSVFSAIALTPIIIAVLRARNLGGLRGDSW